MIRFSNTGSQARYRFAFRQFLLSIFMLYLVPTTMAQWTNMNLNFNSDNLYSIHFTNNSTGFVTGDYCKIFKTTDGGISWTLKNYSVSSWDSLTAIKFIGENTGYAVSSGGKIFKTINGGNDWSEQSSGSGNCLRSIFFLNADTGFVAGNNGTILRTYNGGNTWSTLNTNTTANLVSLCFTNTGIGIAVGNGIIIKTTDYGSTWTSKFSSSSTYFSSVQFFPGSQTNAIAVGGSSTGGAIVFKTSNGGNNWVSQNASQAKSLSALFFVNANTGYACGGAGTILKTLDAGSSWQTQSISTNTRVKSIFFVNADTGYAIYSSKDIIKTTNGGMVPLTILQQPKTQYVNGYKKIKFKISAIGTGPLTYQWKKNGISITGANDSVLTINPDYTELNHSHEGYYSCLISNAQESLLSDSAELMVVDYIEKVGDTIVLELTSKFENIQWQKSIDTTNWIDIPGANSNSFVFISTPELTKKRYYRAVASNTSCTSFSQEISKTIHNRIIDDTEEIPVGAPYRGGKVFFADNNGSGLIASEEQRNFESYPPIPGLKWGCKGTGIYTTNDSDGENNTASIVASCQVTPNAASVCDTLGLGENKNWYLPSKNELSLLLKSDNIFNFNGYYWSSTEYSEDYAWQLSYLGEELSPYSYYTDKNYTFHVHCTSKYDKADQPIKTICTTSLKKELSTLNIIQQPIIQLKKEGNTARFQVAASGKRPFSYQWLKNGIAIPNAKDSILQIFGIDNDDQGFYKCRISNTCKTITTDSAELMITDYIEVSGDTIELYVTNSQATIIWQESNDTINWIDMQGGNKNPFSFISTPSTNGKRFYRAKIYDSICPNLGYFYSKTIRNMVYSSASLLPLGADYQGGTIFYYDTQGNGLIASRNIQSSSIAWGCNGVTTNATSEYDGTLNTTKILASCADRPIAASVCDSLKADGYTDWYLPAIGELNYLYQNKNIIGDYFGPMGLWSSTESTMNIAWQRNGSASIAMTGMKSTTTASVRCIRKKNAAISKKIHCNIEIKNLPIPVSITNQLQDRIVCTGTDSIKFSINTSGSDPISYIWKKDESVIADPGYRILTISGIDTSDMGIYHCQISNSCNTINSNPSELKVILLQVKAEPDTMVCRGEKVNLNTIVNSNFSNLSGKLSYEWSPNIYLDSSNVATPVSTAMQSVSYMVKATDENGCISTDLININTPEPFQEQQICYVEFDTLTQKNKIIWNQHNQSGIDSVIIMKELSLNNWGIIATLSNDISSFTDTTSHPESNSDSYQIMIKDTCGSNSEPSLKHTTITLLTSYTPSTNTLGFNWSHYLVDGSMIAPTYTVYGVDSNKTVHFIGSIPGSQNYYNWINPNVQYKKFFIGFNTSCVNKSNFLVRSNYVSLPGGINGIENSESLSDIKFVENDKTIQLITDIDIRSIRAFNSIGETVAQGLNTKTIALPGTGLYFLEIKTDKNIFIRKTILR